jgi:hypothetical protein
MPYSSRANREAKRGLVNKKTAILIHEGRDPKQAYAMANAMVRAGRVTPKGKYVHVRKGSGR